MSTTHKLVPVEPDDAMIDAGIAAMKQPRQHVNHTITDQRISFEIGLRAALAAAPAPPADLDAIERERVMKVLEPLATLARLLDEAGREAYTPDSDAVIATRPSPYARAACTVGDLRAARALLDELRRKGSVSV